MKFDIFMRSQTPGAFWCSLVRYVEALTDRIDALERGTPPPWHAEGRDHFCP